MTGFLVRKALIVAKMNLIRQEIDAQERYYGGTSVLPSTPMLSSDKANRLRYVQTT